ncbi:hypothetical protein [Endozoicomonas sp. 2B-B]
MPDQHGLVWCPVTEVDGNRHHVALDVLHQSVSVGYLVAEEGLPGRAKSGLKRATA